jgi:hypothetical protein
MTRRIVNLVLVLTCLTTLASCTLILIGDKDYYEVGSGSMGSTGGSVPPDAGGLKVTDKVDLLLAIDNSRTMADKQLILSYVLSDFVGQLANPPCVDGAGQPVPNQPLGPEACPPGSERAFTPINDIHIGIVTSSIGGHGSDACPNSEKNVTACPGGETNLTNNDMGHLIARANACAGGVVPTFNDLGFLAWDPMNKYGGETQIGDLNGASGLVPTLRDLVIGVGQVGCGYESQLESWYRFLVEPTPYDHLEIDVNGEVQPVGVDTLILTQRTEFLRPDSLLVVLMLSDENDCSTKESGQFYLSAQQRVPDNPNKQFYLPPARSECEADPNHKCCTSCSLDVPDGCPPHDQDPKCQTVNDQKTDHANVRCWDQKRRFGIDFLHSTDRYVKGLTSPTVQDRNGAVFDNPIFSKINPADEASVARDSSLVLLVGIVGVPWQDIARRNSQDQPDLLAGLDANGNAVGGFKSGSELNAIDKDGHTVWDYIVGAPSNNEKPLDPHMIETTEPRSGTNPLFPLATIAPPGSPNGTNPINGHEYTVGIKNGVFVAKDDLQYACIFELPAEAQRHCFGSNLVSCDCTEAANDNPLCEPDPTNPNGPNARTHQVRAKAYPGLRHLDVLRKLGSQGLVGSICPVQLDNPAVNDYAYRPAARTLLEQMKTSFQPTP